MKVSAAESLLMGLKQQLMLFLRPAGVNPDRKLCLLQGPWEITVSDLKPILSCRKTFELNIKVI